MTLPDAPAVLGHRGCASRAPENTIASFRLAAEEGAAGIELDVHRCSSGETAVIHDYRLARTAGMDAAVEQTPWEVIRGLDAGSWLHERYRGERVPLLGEVFATFGSSLFYDIEIKPEPGRIGPLEEAVVQEIERHGLASRCFVSSFNPLSIRKVARTGCRPETAVLYSPHPGMPFWLRNGQGRFFAGSRILKPHCSQVTERFIARFRKRLGYRIYPWTVDDPAEARRLVALGVDGIISNCPGAILQAIKG